MWLVERRSMSCPKLIRSIVSRIVPAMAGYANGGPGAAAGPEQQEPGDGEGWHYCNEPCVRSHRDVEPIHRNSTSLSVFRLLVMRSVSTFTSAYRSACK